MNPTKKFLCTKPIESYEKTSVDLKSKLLHKIESQNNNSEHLTKSIEINENNISNATHLKEKIFQCKSCPKTYKSKSRYEVHLRTHTGEKPYVCSMCQKRFNEKGNLKLHMRTHTGEKPYVCTIESCQKRFKAYGHLKDHLKRHLNIRNYECDRCAAKFVTNHSLKMHRKIHSATRTFLCHHCGESFKDIRTFKTHQVTHGNSNRRRNSRNRFHIVPIRRYSLAELGLGKTWTIDHCIEYFYTGSRNKLDHNNLQIILPKDLNGTSNINLAENNYDMNKLYINNDLTYKKLKVNQTYEELDFFEKFEKNIEDLPINNFCLSISDICFSLHDSHNEFI